MTEKAADKDLDLIELALSRILRDNPHVHVGDDANSKLIQDDKDRQLLLRLLDQLNSLRAERDQKALRPISENLGNSDSVVSDDKINKMEDNMPRTNGLIEDDKVIETELIREIRNVKKQNKFTHLALGIILVSSAIWRLSALAAVFRIRNKISNPFKAISGMISGMISGNFKGTLQENMGSHLPRVETPRLLQMETPSLPHIEMPSMDNFLNSRQLSGSNGPAGQVEENISLFHPYRKTSQVTHVSTPLQVPQSLAEVILRGKKAKVRDQAS